MAESKHGVAKYSTALLLVAIGVLAYGLASSTDLRAQETHPGFVPKDLEVYGVQGYDHHAVLVYQYHLEFYDLPEDIVVGHEPEHPNNPPLLFKKGKREFIRDIPSLGLKPMNVMRFQHRIKFPSIAAHEDRNFIWA
jgi:hypothetical protein